MSVAHRARGSLLRRFARADGGVAAIEFCLVVPFMLVALFGLVVVGDLLLTRNRLQIAGATVGDVIARTPSSASLQTSDEQDILKSVAIIMGAHAVATPNVRVSQVVVGNTKQQYEWSDVQGSYSPFGRCADVSIPQLTKIQSDAATKLSVGTRVIVTEVSYTWSPPYKLAPIASTFMPNERLSFLTLTSPRFGAVNRSGVPTTPACTPA